MKRSKVLEKIIWRLQNVPEAELYFNVAEQILSDLEKLGMKPPSNDNACKCVYCGPPKEGWEYE